VDSVKAEFHYALNWANTEWDSMLTEPTLNETSWWLSQGWMRLHVDWTNAEWDSVLTEPTLNETTWKLNQCWMRLNVDWINAKWDSMLTEPALNKSPCWLNQRWMRLHVDWTSAEWDSMLTEPALNESPCDWTSAEWDSMWLNQPWMRLHVDWTSAEWGSMFTDPTLNETPCRLNQCWMKLHVDWINAEWDSMLTEPAWSENPVNESTQNDQNIKYLGEFSHIFQFLCKLSVDLVDVSLIFSCRFSRYVVELALAHAADSYSASIHCAEDLISWRGILHWQIQTTLREKFNIKKQPRNVQMGLRSTRNKLVFFLPSIQHKLLRINTE
jgi:hypothetical protein